MNLGRKLSTCSILLAMVGHSVTWRHSSILLAQQFRARLTSTLTSQWLRGHSRISSLNRPREIKKMLMLILSYIFLFARNHYHPTGIANWPKTPLFLSPAVWVNRHILRADPAFNIASYKGPRSCIPHNFEILPERNVTVENYCAVIHFFYRKG